jgi:PAS domain S-box-containing protein
VVKTHKKIRVETPRQQWQVPYFMEKYDSSNKEWPDRSHSSSADLYTGSEYKLFQFLIDVIEDQAISALDPHGKIISWSLGAKHIFGYPAESVLGTNFSRLYTNSAIINREPQNELSYALANGKFEALGWRVRSDGTLIWTSFTIARMQDEFGALQGFAYIVRDLSEQRQAEVKLNESEERFQLMVESVVDYAIFMLDTKGNVTTWNKGAERNKGYSANEILGHHFSKFYLPIDIENRKPQQELEEALAHGRFEDEGWRLRKDGSQFWANVVLTPIFDNKGRHKGFSKVTRDLTERKKTEDEIRTAYLNLEEKIKNRTEELARAKAKAEDAVKARDRFFSIASHELQTPIAAFKLKSQIRRRNLANGKMPDFSSAQFERILDEDDGQIDRLVFLVDNLLDITKLTSHSLKLNRERIEINDLIKDIVRRMDPILKASENICLLKTTKVIYGNWDRYRLEQVITNLLTNAGKYAPGNPIEIVVTSDDDYVKVNIQDHGEGISKADQERILLPFERVKHENENGLGLGLYISTQIIEAHAGQLEIKSTLGVGSSFSVLLPLS